MSFPSVDKIQNLLAETVFKDRMDAKKAAGRSLGTFVEIITYYLLREWGYKDNIVIEYPISEYRAKSLTHNVEFSLHPHIKNYDRLKIADAVNGYTSLALLKRYEVAERFVKKPNKPIAKNIVSNSCLIGTSENRLLLSVVDGRSIYASEVYDKPYAMFECKRVGKEGNAKGPQTIEKAKQGAYVARMVSSLQRVYDGSNCNGLLYVDGNPVIKPYEAFLKELVYEEASPVHRDFCMTVGVVSNHGNWFTSDNPNKELQVLSSSYDWLLFLTDRGLVEFVEWIKNRENSDILSAFERSYLKSENKKKEQQFTKKQMEMKAHIALCEFFHANISSIENWFNVINPKRQELQGLKEVLSELNNKKWSEIL